MKRSKIIGILLGSALLITGSVTPPELVTKSYLDNLLYTKLGPINQQLTDIGSQFKVIEAQLAAVKAKLSLRVDVVIDSSTAYVDGQARTLDVPPAIVNGRTFVPVRFIGEAFGADFSWDQNLQKVTYSMENNYIELFIGHNQAYINGTAVPLDAPPLILESRTLVPFRFMGQSIGARVEWNGDTRTATILK
ncbi:MAG: copper amine oxidase N-terminal domain-containing protein [Peptococcaceae bacterium]